MPRSFNWSEAIGAAGRTVQLRLKLACGTLAVLNAVALFLYFVPPGGTRDELTQESAQLRNRIAAARLQAKQLGTTSTKVQAGSSQSYSFETIYFLPKRTAYERIIGEIQRMAKASAMQERDGVFSEEPIEGTPDLSLLSVTANYAGAYTSLLRFLYEVDHSPMLLMLDTLNAAPQPKNGEINTSIRFQAIVTESGSNAAAATGERQ